jgi:hypothetical protein
MNDHQSFSKSSAEQLGLNLLFLLYSYTFSLSTQNNECYCLSASFLLTNRAKLHLILFLTSLA